MNSLFFFFSNDTECDVKDDRLNGCGSKDLELGRKFKKSNDLKWGKKKNFFYNYHYYFFFFYQESGQRVRP